MFSFKYNNRRSVNRKQENSFENNQFLQPHVNATS